MGGRIDCPTCDYYLTPEEVTVGLSLGCPACAGAEESAPSDAGPGGNATTRTAGRAPGKGRARRSFRLLHVFAPLPA